MVNNSDIIIWFYSELLANVYIIESTFDGPTDITAIPQSYTVHHIIITTTTAQCRYFYQDNTGLIELNSAYCTSQTGCNCVLDANTDGIASNMTPEALVDSTITVTWEAEEISSGAFRQTINNGDHHIQCNTTSFHTIRISTIVIKGNFITYGYYIIIIMLAPSSSPTDITVVSGTTTSVTVNWMYDTSDADGYMVYYNGTAKRIEGEDKETTLDGLIPGTTYSITVRAYQDILGPPSTTLTATTGDGKYSNNMHIIIILLL